MFGVIVSLFGAVMRVPGAARIGLPSISTAGHWTTVNLPWYVTGPDEACRLPAQADRARATATVRAT